MIKKLIRYAGLPFVFIVPMTLYGAFSTSANAPLAAMLCGVLGGLLVVAMEALLPYRQDWRPTWKHLKIDFQFMAFVHLAFLEVVGAGIAFLLLTQLGSKSPLASLWPQHWPVWGQALLVVFAADFLRYWAHRAFHEVPFLWPVHAVHHVIDRLYALNTTHFHPLEMLTQYAVMTLPFVLLGVDPQVFGYWIVLHFVIGFTTHCNIDFYFGKMGRFVMTPDVHRWHHSFHIEESNGNYAVAFCLWDRVFGTFYLPEGRAVGKLGIDEPDYPVAFLAQMAEPFKKK